MFLDKGQNKRLFRLEGLFTEYTLKLSNSDFVRGQECGTAMIQTENTMGSRQHFNIATSNRGTTLQCVKAAVAR